MLFIIYILLGIAYLIFFIINIINIIVRNSPLNSVASSLAIMKVLPQPILKLSVLCVGGVVGGDLLYERVFPNAPTPLSKIGKAITNVTGYNPNINKEI